MCFGRVQPSLEAMEIGAIVSNKRLGQGNGMGFDDFELVLSFSPEAIVVMLSAKEGSHWVRAEHGDSFYKLETKRAHELKTCA
jgi:hypothetical protein